MRRSSTGCQQYKVLKSDDCSDENNCLTVEILKKESRCFDLDIIFTFRYSGKGLRTMSGLDPLENLTCLDLSGNQIERMEGLENLESLEKLNLGSNRIRRIENIEKLKRLKALSLEHNRIQEVDDLDLEALSKLIGLSDLRLKGVEMERSQNPVCSHSKLSDTIFASLPNLERLDGERRHCLCLSALDQEIDALNTNPPKKVTEAVSWSNPEPFFSTSSLTVPLDQNYPAGSPTKSEINECKETIQRLRELDSVLCKKICVVEGCNDGK